MPKKQAHNAFFYYMIDFRAEQKKKGIEYKNLAEVAAEVGKFWEKESPENRSKYEARAKREKQQHAATASKLTSSGVPLEEIERQKKEEKDYDEAETKDIKNLIKLKGFNDSIQMENFYLMDVNHYCQVRGEYVICESTILRFNLVDGIVDDYHEVINIGKSPLGYAHDVIKSCKTYGMEYPDEDAPVSDYKHIMANMMDYFNVKGTGNRNAVPMIFTMPGRVPMVQNFIQQLCYKSAIDDSMFRVYKVTKMFFHLINTLKSRPDEGFPKESLPLYHLERDVFRNGAGLACNLHEEKDKAIYCSKSRAKRMAFTIMDFCCPVAGLDMKAGKHLPIDFDVEAIMAYNESMKRRTGPTIGPGMAMFPDNTNSSLSESFADCSVSTLEDEPPLERPKREYKHKPLRKPNEDFGDGFIVPPTLTQASFPTVGVGRGRGMVRKN